VSDLAICRHMGWTYDALLTLPAEVYAVLIEELAKENL